MNTIASLTCVDADLAEQVVQEDLSGPVPRQPVRCPAVSTLQRESELARGYLRIERSGSAIACG